MKGYLGEITPDETPYDNWTPTEWALEYITRYGGIDGSHHKQWVLDQTIRILKNTPVIVTLAQWDNGYSEWRFTTGEPSKAYMDFIEENEGFEKGCAP